MNDEIKESIDKDLSQLKKGAIKIMAEIDNLEKKVSKTNKEYSLSKDENLDLSIANYLYSALEMQQDREQEKIEKIMDLHEDEKTKIREDFNRWRKWTYSIILVLIIGIFGTLIWFFTNFEFADFRQEVTMGNATYLGGNGKVINGETDD